MMRSASFSRLGSSSTTRNWPLPVRRREVAVSRAELGGRGRSSRTGGGRGWCKPRRWQEAAEEGDCETRPCCDGDSQANTLCIRQSGPSDEGSCEEEEGKRRGAVVPYGRLQSNPRWSRIDSEEWRETASSTVPPMSMKSCIERTESAEFAGCRRARLDAGLVGLGRWRAGGGDGRRFFFSASEPLSSGSAFFFIFIFILGGGNFYCFWFSFLCKRGKERGRAREGEKDREIRSAGTSGGASCRPVRRGFRKTGNGSRSVS